MTLKSPAVREQALNLLFSTWRYQDPKASQAAATRLWKDVISKNEKGNYSPKSFSLKETLAHELGELQGKEAYETAVQVSDPDLRLAAVEAALRGWYGRDGENLPVITEFLVNKWQSPKGSSTDGDAGLTFATQWTVRELADKDRDLKRAIAFLEKLPTGSALLAAIEGIVTKWSSSPEMLTMISAWVKALPRSPQKDVAAVKLTEEIAIKSPAEALDLAAAIEAPDLRAKTLASVAAPFIPKDQGGTKAFDLETWARDHPELMNELRAVGPNE